MKIKEISKLTDEELDLFFKSPLYNQSQENYIYCDIHQQYYREYWENKWTDLSLIAFDKDGVYILMYMYANEDELSYFGEPIEVYSDETAKVKVLARAYQELFAKLETYKKELGVNLIRFSNNQHFVYKYYGTEGFKENVTYYSYINLQNTEEEIFMNIRKSYKSLINWGKRNMSFKVYDENCVTEEVFEKFENFHIEISKRRTRSHASWMLQYEAVTKGMGFVIFGYLEGVLATAILILSGLEECFYGVCVNRRDMMEEHKPIGHATLLKSIMVAKEKGFRRFNIGNVTNRLDPKANDIVLYQRGFNTILDARLTFEANI